MLFLERNKLKVFFMNRISYSIILIFFCQSLLFSQSNLDSLWSVWNDESQSDRNRIEAVHEYTVRKYLNRSPDTAFYLSQLEFKFADERGLKKYKGPALRTQSRALYRQGKYELTIKTYELAQKMYEEVNDLKGKSDALNGIALANRRLGDGVKAAQYHYDALKIKEQIGDKSGASKVLNNIGILHYNNGNYEKAIDFYSRSLSVAEEVGNKNAILRLLNNLGNVYDVLAKDSIAINYYQRSIELCKELRDELGLARALHNIGVNYSNQGKYDKALGEEQKWKEGESKRIIKEQIRTAGKVGKTLDELIYNYNKSMSLLELRPKKNK